MWCLGGGLEEVGNRLQSEGENNDYHVREVDIDPVGKIEAGVFGVSEAKCE